MIRKCAFFSLFIFAFCSLYAQDSTSFRDKGHIYGQVFGDYFFKAHADSLQRGSYQYSRQARNSSAFQIRRIYLGYKYDISPKFRANILMESVGRGGSMDFFIKYAALQWNDIFRGSNLSIGRMKTPTFSTLTDKVWNYRSVERTVADMQGSPSYDLGMSLDGHFNASGDWGYHLMVGNGEGNSLTDDRFKKFYGEIYGKPVGDKLIVDVYADYERYHWQPALHQSAQMFKIAVAYQSSGFTAGVESYTQRLQGGAVVEHPSGADTVNVRNYAVSVFARGTIIKDKLGFFARIDHFNPFVSPKKGAKPRSLITPYDPVNKLRFITAGVDYSPAPAVHFIPNIWYSGFKDPFRADQDYDLVYRLTFYYHFES